MNPLLLAIPPAVFTAYWKLRGRGYKIDKQGRYVILDYEHPKLSLFNTAFNFLGGFFPAKRLDMDDLIRKAQERSGGLTDLGNEKRFPFREALEVLLRDANSANLTPLGRLAVQDKVVQALTDRLLMEELIKQHPEILDEEIWEPVFILGIPRSGTTHTQRCLAQTDELRPLKAYEAWFPVSAEEVRDGVQRGEDPRVKMTKKAFDTFNSGRPLFNLFHDLDPNLPEEHFQLCDGVFRSFSPLLIFFCAEYLRWNSETDATVQFDYLRRCLQIVRWRDAQLDKPKRRFLLKYTDDIFHIPALKRVFPDARIIHLHRDTVSSLLSGMTFMSYMESLTCNLDIKETGEAIANYYEKSLKRVDWTGYEDHTCHVHFKDFVKDNVGTLKEVCNALELEISEKSWDKVSNYVEQNGQHKNGRVYYDLKTFGMTREELEDRFKFYSIHGSALAPEQ